MNLSQLNYFKKLAEVLHYTRAAQELFITQPFSNLHQVRVEGIPEHFYTVYMAYHKKHVHSRAVADFIDFVKAYPGNDLIGQVLPTAPAE